MRKYPTEQIVFWTINHQDIVKYETGLLGPRVVTSTPVLEAKKERSQGTNDSSSKARKIQI